MLKYRRHLGEASMWVLFAVFAPSLEKPLGAAYKAGRVVHNDVAVLDVVPLGDVLNFAQNIPIRFAFRIIIADDFPLTIRRMKPHYQNCGGVVHMYIGGDIRLG